MGRLLSKIQINKKYVAATFFVLLINLQVYSKPPMWYTNFKQIKLMISTKQDVEKLFNYPKISYVFDGDWSENIDYKIKEGKLSVSYSQGKCSENYQRGYNVEKDIVIGITLYLEKEVSYQNLGIVLDHFDRREISDLVGVFTYVNDSTGEWFNGTSQKLNDFQLFPTKNKDYLKCKDIKK